MTLGSTPQPSDVVAELRASFPYTFPDAATRWLAGVGAGASITFPTSFASTAAVKLVATTSLSASGTSHSFAGTALGAAYTGRLIVGVIFCLSKDSLATPSGGQNITSVAFGGDTAGPASLVYWQLGSGSTVLIGNTVFRMDATSGTSSTLSFTTPFNTRCIVYVYSVANCSVTAFAGNGDASGSVSSLAVPINVASNGVIIAGAGGVSAGSITWGNATEDQESVPLAGYRVGTAWSNRLNSETNRSVSASFGSAVTCVIGCTSLT